MKSFLMLGMLLISSSSFANDCKVQDLIGIEVTHTYSRRSEIPGDPIGANPISGNYTKLQSQALVYNSEMLVRSENKIVLSAELGSCNYRRVDLDGTRGPVYCQVKMCIR